MTLNHTHTIYDHVLVANEIEDMYKSKLDMCQFVTVDNDLEGTAGMEKEIHTYTATPGAEKLEMGEGNTKKIEVSFTKKNHKIVLAQAYFPWYDEEAMKDPNLVPVGTQRLAADMWQTTQDDIYAAFKSELNTNKVECTGNYFDDFVDAIAMLNHEEAEDVSAFAFLSRKDAAAVRKSLGEQLKYVEAYVRRGYIGTVAGVNLYTKKDAVEGYIYGGTRKAVTLFNKKGVEMEMDRDPNVRLNEWFARKYYLAALTDAREAFAITPAA